MMNKASWQRLFESAGHDPAKAARLADLTVGNLDAADDTASDEARGKAKMRISARKSGVVYVCELKEDGQDGNYGGITRVNGRRVTR